MFQQQQHMWSIKITARERWWGLLKGADKAPVWASHVITIIVWHLNIYNYMWGPEMSWLLSEQSQHTKQVVFTVLLIFLGVMEKNLSP